MNDLVVSLGKACLTFLLVALYPLICVASWAIGTRQLLSSTRLRRWAIANGRLLRGEQIAAAVAAGNGVLIVQYIRGRDAARVWWHPGSMRDVEAEIRDTRGFHGKPAKACLVDASAIPQLWSYDDILLGEIRCNIPVYYLRGRGRRAQVSADETGKN